MAARTAPVPEGWEIIIGLEIHAQLKSASKIYCADPVAYGESPNTLVSPVSLGHPGTLPVLNAACVDLAIKMGLATACQIRRHSHFARKNYFYPDLSKGYQISQDDTPICFAGELPVRLPDGSERTIGITRIHLEEDAGKNLHDQDLYDSLVDYNRCGTGLIEIVSEPDMRTPEEAAAYVTEVRKIVRYLDICDGNMEEGSMRVDANISVRKLGEEGFRTRSEVKNINSISNVAKAIAYEAQRQVALYEAGETFPQQTRNWDAGTGTTTLLREKESADDYRYFPEPDLSPLVVTEAHMEALRAELPALPRERFAHYTQELGLPDHDAGLLTETRAFAEYFEAALPLAKDAKALSKWLNGPVKTYLNEYAVAIGQFPLPPERMAQLVQLVESGKVSFSVAKDQLFSLQLAHPDAATESLAAQHNLLLDTDTNEIKTAAAAILAANPDKVATYRAGKTGLLGFFVGQLMKQFKGKADPKQINAVVTELLEAEEAEPATE